MNTINESIGANFIEYNDLKNVIDACYDYLETDNKDNLIKLQPLIKLAKDIDFSILTKAEQASKTKVIESHGPARMLTFLFNYFGEHYLVGGKIFVKNDDSIFSSLTHNNGYRLEFNEEDTHDKLFSGTPTGNGHQDFIAEFLYQETVSYDKKIITTNWPYDSLHDNKWHRKDTAGDIPEKPRRTFEFKSYFWKSGNEHNADYVLQLTRDKKLRCIQVKTYIEKQVMFRPAEANVVNLGLYYKYCDYLPKLQGYSWDDFILD